MRSTKLFLLLLIFLKFLFCASCAHPIAPTGGPKDETPPMLDSLRSTANLQTQFSARHIDLAFDEWVRLDNPLAQVVISPPLAKQPSIKLRGKTLRLAWHPEEVLRKDATYVISFGEAIKDLTEGNVPKDLQFIFSTGNQIDSLELSGRLLDATNGKPIQGAVCMLYENATDSVVYKERPYYFARSDKDGRFKMRYLKKGDFKVFALVDANQNYRYDQEREKIGFLDALFTLPSLKSDSVQLFLFEEKTKPSLIGTDLKNFGRVKLFCNQKIDKNFIDTIDLDKENFILEPDKDTLNIWYDAPTATKWKIVTQNNDTIKITTPDRAVALKKYTKLSTSDLTTRSTLKTIAQPDTAFTLFTRPLKRVDETKVFLLEDTLATRVQPQIDISKEMSRRLGIRHAWKTDVQYELLLAPGALTDLYGNTNDSIRVRYLPLSEKNFGKIKLSLTQLDPKKQYVALLSRRGEQQAIRPPVILKGKNIANISFAWLEPAEYDLKVIEEIIENGEWDAGDYANKRQAERVFWYNLQALRANWEVEADFQLKP